ncbi:hypothetical protein [Xanthovirga aplysinae]|uniref:hypothetical protein n=1 Tax=Xanthovirga aplysinae TaxID=2529853 RepID=UPI0012BD246A|nr:hypothetical protein [Xanthovirga aplysinae]MTI30689.1 hypothetical protein [Xanthovirga aplysinae]
MAKKNFGVKSNSFMGKVLSKESALNSSLKESGKKNVFKKIQIHPELKQYIASLSEEEFRILESSVVKERKVRDPLLLWKYSEECYYILDGHHRYSVLEKNQDNEIDWNYQLIELDGLEAAFELMEEIQLGRRNATKNYIAYLRGRSYLREKGKHGGGRSSGKGRKSVDLVAERFKVGSRTIIRDSYFALGIDCLKEVFFTEREQLLQGGGMLSKAEVSFLGQYNNWVNIKDFIEFLSKGGSLKVFDEVPKEQWVDLISRRKGPKKKESNKTKRDRFNYWLQAEEKIVRKIVSKGNDEERNQKRIELEKRVTELQGLILELKNGNN